MVHWPARLIVRKLISLIYNPRPLYLFMICYSLNHFFDLTGKFDLKTKKPSFHLKALIFCKFLLFANPIKPGRLD